MTFTLNISSTTNVLSGRVKWFDTKKGFGFVTVDSQDKDVLLSSNILRNYGQSSVVEDSRIEFVARVTKRGMQVTDIISIEAPIIDHVLNVVTSKTNTPLVPGRVKWFDISKGFGFANEFGSKEDIFVHIETLRQCGLAHLQEAEAISMRIQDGNDGLIASEVHAWNYAVDHD